MPGRAIRWALSIIAAPIKSGQVKTEFAAKPDEAQRRIVTRDS